jgi:amino acid transporter
MDKYAGKGYLHMTQSTQKFSLLAAILININIMIGSGIFINTTILAQKAGILGAASYAIIGLLMLPLILSISQLLKIHPTGGFYGYAAAEISPFIGFLSAWCYFISKLASSTLTIHVSVSFLQQLFPTLAALNIFMLDGAILSMFLALNMKNIKTNESLQAVFTILKMFPIIFLILVGFMLFNFDNLSPVHWHAAGIPATLPLVLFAILGFEAACSLSSKIENPAKNASRAVLISYGIVIFIYCAYQFAFYGILGDAFYTMTDYRQAFPAVIADLLPNHASVKNLLITLLHLGIISSALSASYGIILSNSWNLYTLAQHKYTFKPSWFTHLNRHAIPWLCVLAEGAVCLIYLYVTHGSQIPLQITSALGSVIAYTLSVSALLAAKRKGKAQECYWITPLLGFTNCMVLLTACSYRLWYEGIASLCTFGSLMLFGIAMFLYMQSCKTN